MRVCILTHPLFLCLKPTTFTPSLASYDLDDEAIFIEVKRKEENFDADVLHEKVEIFTRATGKFKEYTVSQKGFSMNDM